MPPELVVSEASPCTITNVTDTRTGIFLYRRESVMDDNGCVLRNNSAGIGDSYLNSRYGIACNRPDSSYTVTWYNPNGHRVVELMENNTDTVFFGMKNGDPEIRRSSNFKALGNGVYTCAITDENGNRQYLFVGLYRIIPANFIIVNLTSTCSNYLVLNCSSSSLPATTVSWYFNDRPITVGEQVQFISSRMNAAYSSLLRIGRDEISRDMLEEGQYRCRLESGTSSINATLLLGISKKQSKY
jgi:hypothetical protein